MILRTDIKEYKFEDKRKTELKLNIAEPEPYYSFPTIWEVWEKDNTGIWDRATFKTLEKAEEYYKLRKYMINERYEENKKTGELERVGRQIKNWLDFNSLTKEELKIYGDKIPMGKTYDDDNNQLTFKDEEKWWERDYLNGNEITIKDNKGDWTHLTRNETGEVLTVKTNGGYWEKNTYEDGRLIKEESSKGWKIYNYNKHGSETYYESSDGNWRETFYDENNNEFLYGDPWEWRLKKVKITKNKFEKIKKGLKKD